MRLLIGQIRDSMPFDLPEARLCQGPCDGCSMKLLDYMESELLAWEHRLASGETPNFGDLKRLAGSGKKILAVLQRNGLVEPPADPVPQFLRKRNTISAN